MKLRMHLLFTNLNTEISVAEERATLDMCSRLDVGDALSHLQIASPSFCWIALVF